MNTQALNIRYFVFLIIISLSTTAYSVQTPRLQFVNGDVKAIDLKGKIRVIKKGDALYPGEKLITGKGAIAQLRIFGQGVISMRESTQCILNSPVGGEYGISLHDGIIRTVTALAGKTGQIEIKTPRTSIFVKKGDTQTGVKTLKSGDKSIINQVLAGKALIKSKNTQQLASIGDILLVNTGKTGITKLNSTPDTLKLSVSNFSAISSTKNQKAKEISSSLALNSNASLASINTLNLKLPLEINLQPSTGSIDPFKAKNPVLIQAPSKTSISKSRGETVITPTIQTKVVDIKTIDILTPAERTTLNSSFILIFNSPITKEPVISSITTTDTERLNLLTKEVSETLQISTTSITGGKTIIPTTSLTTLKEPIKTGTLTGTTFTIQR
jgi:hypothetical protein